MEENDDDEDYRLEAIPGSTCADATEIWELLAQVKINDSHAMILMLIEKHKLQKHHEADCFVNWPTN